MKKGIKLGLPVCTLLLLILSSCGESKSKKNDVNPSDEMVKPGIRVENKVSEQKVDIFFGDELFHVIYLPG